jgi:uncharacterized protein (TIGR00725 family)
MRGPIIGVVGAGSCSDEVAELARQVGSEIARRGAVLVCGGLGGVMQEAARGAKEQGGLTVGILPGPNVTDANSYVDVAIATNMGHARNAIIVETAQALIAVAGGYGTLAEIALALKAGKPVVALRPQFEILGIERADTAGTAVAIVFNKLVFG